MADELAGVLAEANPTPFAGEGPAVFALRAKRCLAGWPYEIADYEARQIVQAALRLVGMPRPNWKEGQPIELADMSETCTVCDAPLYGYYESAFCSRRCSNTHHNAMTNPKRAAAVRHYNEKLSEIISARRAEARAALCCEICRVQLAAHRKDQKYCSWKCARRGRDLDSPLRECQWCRELFRRYAQPGRPLPRFCNHGCQMRWRHANKGAGPLKVRAGSAEATGKPGSNVGES